MNYTLAIVAGNLTRDPELRQIPSGTSVCDFTIAVNDGWGDREHASFIGCQAWGDVAERGRYQ